MYYNPKFDPHEDELSYHLTMKNFAFQRNSLPAQASMRQEKESRIPQPPTMSTARL